MCVILVADEVRPNEDMVDAAFECNKYGAGIAWRNDGKVYWKKGLNLDEIQEEVKKAPLPFISHFRIPSVGGPSTTLCHPFPVDINTDLALTGSTKGSVLFHNGTWSDWKNFSMQTALKSPGVTTLPKGRWSDSRAMAWVTAIYGLGILEWIDEKSVVFGPEGDIHMFGGPWDVEEGIWVSNKGWKSKYYHGQIPASLSGKPKDEKPDLTKVCAYSTPAKEVGGKKKEDIPFALSEALRRFNLPKNHADKISKNALKRAKKQFMTDLQGTLKGADKSPVSRKELTLVDPRITPIQSRLTH